MELYYLTATAALIHTSQLARIHLPASAAEWQDRSADKGTAETKEVLTLLHTSFIHYLHIFLRNIYATISQDSHFVTSSTISSSRFQRTLLMVCIHCLQPMDPCVMEKKPSKASSIWSDCGKKLVSPNRDIADRNTSAT